MCQVQVFFTWNTLIDTDWMASLANQINALRNKDLTHLRIKHFSNYSELSVNIGQIQPCFIFIHTWVQKRRYSNVQKAQSHNFILKSIFRLYLWSKFDAWTVIRLKSRNDSGRESLQVSNPITEQIK